MFWQFRATVQANAKIQNGVWQVDPLHLAAQSTYKGPSTQSSRKLGHLFNIWLQYHYQSIKLNHWHPEVNWIVWDNPTRYFRIGWTQYFLFLFLRRERTTRSSSLLKDSILYFCENSFAMDSLIRIGHSVKGFCAWFIFRMTNTKKTLLSLQFHLCVQFQDIHELKGSQKF